MRVSTPYLGFLMVDPERAPSAAAALEEVLTHLSAFALGAGLSFADARAALEVAWAQAGDRLAADGDIAELLERERHGDVDALERERYG